MTDPVTVLLASLLSPAVCFAVTAWYLWKQSRRGRPLMSFSSFEVTGMPGIKTPPIYDVSHWKEITDFSIVAPRPALFITKATEGTAFIDDKFVRFFDGAKVAGWQRGCYHYFKNALNATTQAQHFCSIIRPHITDRDFLILDAEETGLVASHLWAWFQEVKRQFPNNRLMIYSRANLLNPVVMTTAEKTYFKQIPVWTAGYPFNPDPINTVPTGYIPDQTKWGPVWLWQYSASGAVTGIQGEVDLNMATPAFLTVLFDNNPPAPQPSDTGLDFQIDSVKVILQATKLSDGSKWKAEYTHAGLNLNFERDE